MWLPQNSFFMGPFWEIFTFPTILSFLRVVRTLFFYRRIAWSSENVSNTYNVSPRCFLATLRRFEVKVFVKNCQKWEFVTSSKLLFYSRFLRNFHFSYDIFISTCRTSLIYLLTYSLDVIECVEYPQRDPKILFRNSTAVWSESLGEKLSKLRKCDLLKIPFL